MYAGIVKRFLTIIVALALVISTSVIVRVKADFAKAKEELRLQLENYNQVHQEYTAAKAKYQQFKTLPTETEAFLTMRRAMAARTQVMQAYFALLAEKLVETGSTPDDVRKSLNSEIEAEKSYLTDFRRKALGAANLQEAENLSSEFGEKQEGWQNITTKYKGVIFTSALVNIAERSSTLVEKTSQTLAATHAITNITDLNLREEKIELGKNKISESLELSKGSQDSFLTIKFDSKSFEAKRAENDAKEKANDAKETLVEAIKAIAEAARDF